MVYRSANKYAKEAIEAVKDIQNSQVILQKGNIKK